MFFVHCVTNIFERVEWIFHLLPSNGGSEYFGVNISVWIFQCVAFLPGIDPNSEENFWIEASIRPSGPRYCRRKCHFGRTLICRQICIREKHWPGHVVVCVTVAYWPFSPLAVLCWNHLVFNHKGSCWQESTHLWSVFTHKCRPECIRYYTAKSLVENYDNISPPPGKNSEFNNKK